MDERRVITWALLYPTVVHRNGIVGGNSGYNQLIIVPCTYLVLRREYRRVRALKRKNMKEAIIGMHVTDGRFDPTGPLACLSPFSVMPWIRSDKCSYLMSNIPMSLMSRIKVSNKSLSHELNNSKSKKNVSHLNTELPYLIKVSLKLSVKKKDCTRAPSLTCIATQMFL